MSRALQLTAAAISVIHVIVYEKLTESQVHALAERRITVKICCDEKLPVKILLKNPLEMSGKKSNHMKFE